MVLKKVLLSALVFSGLALAQGTINTYAGNDALLNRLSRPLKENHARLPLAFEKQAGGSGERFVARGQGYVIGVEKGKALIGVFSKDKKHHAVSLEFAGSQPSRHAVPGSELPGKVNYIHGNDPRKWQIGLPTYARVTYPDTYPGIDVVYYGNQQQLEFDLVVKPGARPQAIRLKVGGAGKLSIDASGALNPGEAAGDLRIALPRIYQEVNGAKKSVAGHYAIVSRDEVAFKIDPFDCRRPLVIDPAIVYSTLLGGSPASNGNFGQGIAIDSSDNMYVTGYTDAQDFPVVNAYQGALDASGSNDGFVTEINAAGTEFLYSTYIGGSAGSQFQAIAVDSTGAAWVAGYTSSTDFPVISPVQAKSGGGQDAVVVKLNPSGVPVFSTYLGGSATDQANGVAVDASLDAYVTGYTNGAFPTTGGVFQSANNGSNGSSNVFVAKFTSAGSELYATLIGGTGSDQGNAVAALNGFAFVTGSSTSGTIPNAPAGGAHTANAGGGDAFVAKVNSTGTALVYFTFLGGPAADRGNAIAVDGLGDAYIAGSTASTGLATANVVQPALMGGIDGFVAELNPGGNSFTYVTYLGGSRQDKINRLAIDGLGNVYVAGQTDSTDFPTKQAVESLVPGFDMSLYQTTDSGAAWTAFDTNIPGAVFEVSFDPVTSGTIVVTTEQGICRTTNGGGSWSQQLSGNFTAGSLSRSPAASSTIYAAEATNTGFGAEAYLSTDGGVTWTAKGFIPEIFYAPGLVTGSGIVADPLTAGTAYAFSFVGSYISGAVQKTTNSGQSWSSASTGLATHILLTSMVAGADGSLYVTSLSSGVYKSTNQGASWVAINSGLPAGVSLLVHSISVSATNPSILFLGAGSQTYTTTNGGTSWTAVAPTPGIGGGSNGADVLAVSPLDSSLVYSWNGYTYVSTDGGNTWTYADSGTVGATIIEFAVDPFNSAHVFAVCDAFSEGFVAKLNSTGTALTWSTYLSDASDTQAVGVATDGAGNAFVTGNSASKAFPNTPGALQQFNFATSAFVTQISDATPACTYTVPLGTTLVTAVVGEVWWYNVLAPSGCTWTASSDQPWATIVYGTSGTGTAVVFIQIATNSTSSSRTATLTLAGQAVTIFQPSASCTYYYINPYSVTVPAAGGPVSVDLTTGPGCSWEIINDSPAISITSALGGIGNATITLTVSANTGAVSRQLSVPVGSTSITINQASSSQTLQTIDFGPLSNQVLGATPPALSATASSGLTVGFTSGSTSVCTVSGTTVTLVAAGTCWITAYQGGNATYASATTVFRFFYVTAGSPSPCDVDKDGMTNVADVQLIINQALGQTQAANDLNGDGVVNAVDVEIEITAAFGLGCAVP